MRGLVSCHSRHTPCRLELYIRPANETRPAVVLVEEGLRFQPARENPYSGSSVQLLTVPNGKVARSNQLTETEQNHHATGSSRARSDSQPPPPRRRGLREGPSPGGASVFLLWPVKVAGAVPPPPRPSIASDRACQFAEVRAPFPQQPAFSQWGQRFPKLQTLSFLLPQVILSACIIARNGGKWEQSARG